MSKRLILVLAIIVALVGGLVGAGCAAPAPAPPAPPAPAPPVPAPTPPAPPAPAPVEVIKWTAQSFGAPAETTFISATKLVEKIAEMSDGRLTIEMLAGGAIVPVADSIEATNEGILDATATGLPMVKDLFPAANLFGTVIGGLTSTQRFLWNWYGGGNELAGQMLEPLENLVYIGSAKEAIPEIWCHSNKPLYGPDDIKGLKMRAYGDSVEVLSLMGAAAVYLPGAEVYEAMQRGVIDAFEYASAVTNWMMGWGEVAEYMYLSPTRAPTDMSSFIANRASWEELTPDLQAIVKQACIARTMGNVAEEMLVETENIQNFIDFGVKVLPLPPSIDEALIAASSEFYDKTAAGDPFYAEVLESQREFQEICRSVGIY